jgi:hypothetical protein
VQTSGGEAGVDLGLAVAAIVEPVGVDGGDDDECGVAREVLLVGDEEQLAAQVARAQRSGERRPAVEAGLEALDGVDGDEVGHLAAA